MSKEKKYVRRGFDIEETLYNSFRALAIEYGLKPKEFLENALKKEIKAMKKEKNKKRHMQ